MVNKIVFQGRFTADPEVKEVGGFPMCEFTVAWSDKYKDHESKCFLRCKTWRANAEFVGKYFKKGQECVIEGRLETESWDKDGQKQSRTVCYTDRVHFCGSKASNQKSESNGEFMDISESTEEELPFT